MPAKHTKNSGSRTGTISVVAREPKACGGYYAFMPTRTTPIHSPKRKSSAPGPALVGSKTSVAREKALLRRVRERLQKPGPSETSARTVLLGKRMSRA